MLNRFFKMAGVAILGVILIGVLFRSLQRPINRGIWMMENVEALTSQESGDVHIRCVGATGFCSIGEFEIGGILFVE